MRSKAVLSSGDATYFTKLKTRFDRAAAVRADVMHGRPPTVDDYSFGFSFANELLKTSRYWPELSTSLKKINEHPEHLFHNIPTIIDDDPSEVLNNLPRVEYDDTGFVPRPKLEADLEADRK